MTYVDQSSDNTSSVIRKIIDSCRNLRHHKFVTNCHVNFQTPTFDLIQSTKMLYDILEQFDHLQSDQFIRILLLTLNDIMLKKLCLRYK